MFLVGFGNYSKELEGFIKLHVLLFGEKLVFFISAGRVEQEVREAINLSTGNIVFHNIESGDLQFFDVS